MEAAHEATTQNARKNAKTLAKKVKPADPMDVVMTNLEASNL